MTFKLFDRPPEGVTVDGKFFRCDFDFRNVLKMTDVMAREDIEPRAKEFLCVKCVYSRFLGSNTAPKLYRAICDVLFEKTPETGGKRLFSFEQDAPLIRAAFRQVYGVDLFRDRLTWFEFLELLHGLPEGNRFNDVIAIRARPMPAPTQYNAKERESLLKAKQAVALHLDEREQANKYQSDVGKVFAGLMGLIQKGSELKHGE